MSSKAFDVLRQAAGAAVCVALLAAAPALAVPAANVEFASGNPIAVSAGGQSRPLTKGSGLESGEAVNTNDGRAQLRFSDGAYVSLQPQTVFRIDDYRYDNKTDGSEHGFFSLLKGGLRTITGLVGRTNKKNYRVTTTVATIGIRGTEYTINYGDSLHGSVGEGEIEVCSGVGCVPFASGQSFVVINSSSTPQLTGRKTDLPPNPPAQPPPSFVSGDQTSQSGTPVGLLLTGDLRLSLVTTLLDLLGSTQVVLGANGAATLIDTCNDGCIVTFQNGLDEFGNDGIIAWGRGLGQENSSPVYLHYVTGIPTPLTDLQALKTGNVVASYSLIGGTAPTAQALGPIPFLTGTLTGGTLVANFGNATVDATVSLSIGGLNFTAQSNGMTIPHSGSIITSNTIDGSNAVAKCTVGSCASVSMNGIFVGPSALRAGIAYDLHTQAIPPQCGGTVCDTSFTSIQGVAAFARNR